MEEDTTEHVHQVGERTPEDGGEAHRQPGDGSQ